MEHWFIEIYLRPGAHENVQYRLGPTPYISSPLGCRVKIQKFFSTFEKPTGEFRLIYKWLVIEQNTESQPESV